MRPRTLVLGLVLAVVVLPAAAQTPPPAGAPAAQPAQQQPPPAAAPQEQITPEQALRLAHQYYDAGQKRQAAEVLRYLVQAQPNNIDAQVFFGQILMELNSYDDSRKLFKMVLSKEPSNFQANLGMGKVYLANSLWTQAAAFFEIAERVAPEKGRSEAKRLLAVVYERLAKVRPSIDKAIEAVEADPQNLDALETLVSVRESAARRDPQFIREAIGDAEKYVEKCMAALARTPWNREAVQRLDTAYEFLSSPPQEENKPKTPGMPEREARSAAANLGPTEMTGARGTVAAGQGILQVYYQAMCMRDPRGMPVDQLQAGAGPDAAAALIRMAEVVRQRALLGLILAEHDALAVNELAVSRTHDPRNIKGLQAVVASCQQLADLTGRLVGKDAYADTSLREKAVSAARRMLAIEPNNDFARQYLESVGASAAAPAGEAGALPSDQPEAPAPAGLSAPTSAPAGAAGK